MSEPNPDGALFDMNPAPPPEKLSRDRRRTARQAEVIRTGMHPLSLALSPLRLHPDAARDPDDRTAPGPRCGTCQFIARYGKHSYLKCLRGYDPAKAGTPQWKPPPLVTAGPGTDLRAWWPACEHWQPAGAEEENR